MQRLPMPDPSEFDEWDETKEEHALAQESQKFHIKHVIKNGVYFAKTPANHYYQLPLALSIKDFEALENVKKDSDSIKILRGILLAFAGKEQAEQLESEPIQVVMNMLMDYSDCLTKSQGAELGK